MSPASAAEGGWGGWSYPIRRWNGADRLGKQTKQKPRLPRDSGAALGSLRPFSVLLQTDPNTPGPLPPFPSSLPPTLKHIGIHGMSNVHLGGPNGSKLERGNSISTRAVTAKSERERERGGSVPVASRRSPLARNKQPVCLKQTTGAPRCHARTCPTDTSRRRFCCCKRCQHEGGGGGGRSAKTGETEPRTNGYR